MSGMSTDHQLAILNTRSGITLYTFGNYKTLIEHAVRASWQEFESVESKIEWLKRLTENAEEERRSDWVDEYFCQDGKACEDCRYLLHEPDVNHSECTRESATDCPALPEEYFPEIPVARM